MTAIMNNSTGLKNNFVLYFSILNIMSCIGVVMLHANGIFWSHPTGRLWITSNIIETVMYFPVPIFFMLSGATLMDYRKRYGTMEFFRRRILKTFIPFLAWSFFGLWFACHFNTAPKLTADLSLKTVLANIAMTKYTGIYWFFPPLFALYLSIPVVSLIPRSRRLFGYILTYGILSYSVLPLVCKLLHFPLTNALQAPFCGGYLIYIFLGYFLANTDIKKKYRIVLYFLSLFGLAVHFFGTLWICEPGQPIDRMFKGYLNIPCVLYSSGIFVFFKYCRFNWLLRFCSVQTIVKLSGCSFGIYLMHIYFVRLIPKYTAISPASIYYRTFGAVGIWLVCSLLVLALKRVPVVRKLVP